MTALSLAFRHLCAMIKKAVRIMKMREVPRKETDIQEDKFQINKTVEI